MEELVDWVPGKGVNISLSSDLGAHTYLTTSHKIDASAMEIPSLITDILSAFRQEIETEATDIPEAEWGTFMTVSSVHVAKKREVLFPETEICDQVIYLLEGIVASEYRYDDKQVITRFFQQGNFSTNIISAATQSLASDALIAITDITYISIPFEWFIQSYLHSPSIGLFIRKKIIQNSLENKQFTTIKTISNTEKKYQFLETHYPKIIRHTPAKYIANFMGISPEALSRFLAKRYKS